MFSIVLIHLCLQEGSVDELMDEVTQTEYLGWGNEIMRAFPGFLCRRALKRPKALSQNYWQLSLKRAEMTI